VQVRIALGRAGLRVAEDATDNRQPEPKRDHDRGGAVSEIVQADAVYPYPSGEAGEGRLAGRRPAGLAPVQMTVRALVLDSAA
jgi:hypothetical protein